MGRDESLVVGLTHARAPKVGAELSELLVGPGADSLCLELILCDLILADCRYSS